MNNPASNFGATPAGGVCIGGDPTCPCQDGDICHYVADPVTETAAMEQWEMIAAIEQMDAHHFTIFAGGVTPDHCHGCGQKWPCRTERLKQEIVAEIRRLKKLESDHV